MNEQNHEFLKNTNVIFKSEARKKLFEGLEIAAHAVMTTLGPRGKTVLIQSHDGSAPNVTKDGVTVSKSIKLRDPIMRMGADLIKEAASQTNDVAGDGTTTATVLTYAMVKQGLRLLEAGYSTRDLCAGIGAAVERIDAELLSSAKSLTTREEIAQVGTISANGDKGIGELIASAMERVGRDGIITVEDAKGMSTSLDVAEGMQFDRGYLSPYFVTSQERMHALYQGARILLTDKKISVLKDLIPILEKIVQTGQPLLIIADDIEGEALQGLVLNRVSAGLTVIAVKAPGYGTHKVDLLNDMATLTGAKLVSSTTGLSLSNVSMSDLGTAKKVVVDARSTTIIGSGGTKLDVEKHVSNLRSQLEDITLSADDVIKLKMRIAKLANGVAVIKVGGATEVEMVEKKYRIEDALNATRAAASEGIVQGGGMALTTIADKLSKTKMNGSPSHAEEMGYQMIIRSCYEPLRKIIENSGDTTPDVVLNEISRSNGLGYNALTGKYVDLILDGVIDPVKVTRTALRNAASVATTFLSIDAVIIDDTRKNNDD